MKNLFTYPNNSSTNFFNPTYYGALVSASQIVSGTEYYIQTVGTTDFTTVGSPNNNVGQFFTATGTPSGTGTAYIARTGILNKMLDLRGEAYRQWPMTFWGTTNHSTQIQSLSKFINYFDDQKHGSNLSIYDFYKQPLTVFSKTAYAVPVTSKQTVVTSAGEPIWQVTHNTAAHINDNDIVDLKSDPSGGSTTTFYVDAIGDTVARLYTADGPATPYNNGISSVRRNNFPIFVRKTSGVKAIFQQTGNGSTGPTAPFGNYDDSTPERLKFFAKDGSTGNPLDADNAGASRTTSISAGDILYGTKTTLDTELGYSLNSLDLFTNTAKSTVPTMTEKYYGTLQYTITNSNPSGNIIVSMTEKALLDISATATGTYTAGTVSSLANLRAKLATESDVATGFGQPLARVTVSGGSDITETSNTFNMDTSLDYDNLWFVNYDSTSGSEAVKVAKQAVANTGNAYTGYRSIAGGSSATVTIHFIDYAMLASGTAETTFMDGINKSHSNGIAKRLTVGESLAYKYFISGKTDIIGPGNKRFDYKDTNNATAYGARFSGTYYELSGSSQPTSQSLTADKTPTIAINLNGSGFLTGYGTLGTITDKVGGVWDNGGDVVLTVDALADTYAPRTPSTVEADETFDTDDYWVNPAFPEGNQTNKAFPTDIVPARATVTYVQPSTTNITQSGKKFVRSSQFVRYKLQVEYAPMGVDDFKKIQKCVLAAQGQSQPFYFPLKYDGSNYILMSDGGVAPSTVMVNVTKLADRQTGQSIFTVGGFTQNQSDALKDGEHIIMTGENGSLAMVVSGHDANNFGEVKFRISHPSNLNLDFGTKFYKNPSHASVTLASDEFEYFVDEQELYYVTVNFDLDNFK
jgi:hypothetical protein